jgi:hypothetical protein
MAKDERSEVRDQRRETRAFWTGLFLLLVALTVSVEVHAKDASTLLVLRVLAGLGLALMIAYIPGFFALDTAVNRPTQPALWLGWRWFTSSTQGRLVVFSTNIHTLSRLSLRYRLRG